MRERLKRERVVPLSRQSGYARQVTTAVARRAGTFVVDSGLVLERQVAPLTVFERPSENRVCKVDLTIQGPAPVEQFGLHGGEERPGKGVVEPVSDAAHRHERSTASHRRRPDAQATY